MWLQLIKIMELCQDPSAIHWVYTTMRVSLHISINSRLVRSSKQEPETQNSKVFSKTTPITRHCSLAGKKMFIRRHDLLCVERLCNYLFMANDGSLNDFQGLKNSFKIELKFTKFSKPSWMQTLSIACFTFCPCKPAEFSCIWSTVPAQDALWPWATLQTKGFPDLKMIAL